ncbi:hypothetical protein LSH36_517g03002 [Paralvinella palmiformis]|uniref:Uncharacterized protein n=1 Tax=Paralvinella palmiformis TaxID=53620 RepID=A0AAD9J7V0_9ANNE|nr:hypothetical protein LSH36_517g03002 [Paralvinella palmiformis]
MNWPDFGVPEEPNDLIAFVITVRRAIRSDGTGPIVVHCSAGVGRTGSFIAIDRLLQHIKYNSVLDIFSVVLEMRNYRLYMIQVEVSLFDVLR